MKASSGSGEWPSVKVRCDMRGKVTLAFRMSRVESARGPRGAHLDTPTVWPELMFSLSSPQVERAGERRSLLLNAPLPVPRPTRPSRGEGENLWWLCHLEDAPAAELVIFPFVAAVATGYG